MVIFILPMKKSDAKKLQPLPQGETVVDWIAHQFLQPLEPLDPSLRKDGRAFWTPVL